MILPPIVASERRAKVMAEPLALTRGYCGVVSCDSNLR